MSVTALRRISQISFFILLIYGGSIFLKEKIKLPIFIDSRAPEEFKEMSMTQKAPLYNQPFETYMPIRTCRYARGTGMFRACHFHFFQEAISWKDPPRVYLPQIFLFIVLGFMFGRLLCGWVCPIGFIQESLSILRKWCKIKRFRLKEKHTKFLRLAGLSWIAISLIAAYIVTIQTLPYSVREGLYLFGCQTCPSRIISSIITGFPITIGMHSEIMLILFILCIFFLLFYLFGFFVKRLWCRFCPAGIILSFFNQGRLFTKNKDITKCNRCGICATVCSMDTRYIYNEKRKTNIDHKNCINCFRCIDKCPENGCLKLDFFGLSILKS